MLGRQITTASRRQLQQLGYHVFNDFSRLVPFSARQLQEGLQPPPARFTDRKTRPCVTAISRSSIVGTHCRAISPSRQPQARAMRGRYRRHCRDDGHQIYCFLVTLP